MESVTKRKLRGDLSGLPRLLRRDHDRMYGALVCLSADLLITVVLRRQTPDRDRPFFTDHSVYLSFPFKPDLIITGLIALPAPSIPVELLCGKRPVQINGTVGIGHHHTNTVRLRQFRFRGKHNLFAEHIPVCQLVTADLHPRMRKSLTHLVLFRAHRFSAEGKCQRQRKYTYHRSDLHKNFLFCLKF